MPDEKPKKYLFTGVTLYLRIFTLQNTETVALMTDIRKEQYCVSRVSCLPKSTFMIIESLMHADMGNRNARK